MVLVRCGAVCPVGVCVVHFLLVGLVPVVVVVLVCCGAVCPVGVCAVHLPGIPVPVPVVVCVFGVGVTASVNGNPPVVIAALFVVVCPVLGSSTVSVLFRIASYVVGSVILEIPLVLL